LFGDLGYADIVVNELIGEPHPLWIAAPEVDRFYIRFFRMRPKETGGARKNP
jgi:hypothetical protein